MNGKNGQKILKLFDYFKIAFRLNSDNKQLYKPQIIYLVLRGLLIFLTGLSLANIAQELTPLVGNVTFAKFFTLFWSEFRGTPLLIMITTLLVALFGATYVEAGLYTMYAKLNRGDHDHTVFTTGANRHFFSFLLGNIVIAIFWMIILIPYLIVGAITLTLGFVWVPIIISSLLMVWKASIVSDEVGLFTAINNSIDFGKRHFIPANVYIIIQAAISKSGGSSGGSSNPSQLTNSMNSNNSGFNEIPFQGPNPYSMNDLFDEKLVSMIIAITAGLLGIISILSGMISMIFQIFFGLTTVIIYQDDWSIDLTEENTEVEATLEVE